MPRTSRLAMTLVKSDPGPSVIRSASSIASTASSRARASGGEIVNSRIGAFSI